MLPIRTEKVKITSKYGYREYFYQGKLKKGFHRGIDLIPIPYDKNSEIIAFEGGVVVKTNRVGKQYGKGCFVRLKHSNGLNTLYYHLKSNSIVVKVGDKVKKGQKLGIIGTTGISTGVHLHFQIDKGVSSTSINPYDYLFKGKELIEPKTNFLGKRGYIRFGDRSESVGKIALFMRKTFPAYTSKKALGNFYGYYIKKSIKEFQRRTGLETDGNIGPITLAKLRQYGFKY